MPRDPRQRRRRAVGVTGLGLPGAQVARPLGVTPMAVWRGLARGPAYLRERGLTADGVAREALQQVD